MLLLLLARGRCVKCESAVKSESVRAVRDRAGVCV